MQVPAEYLPLLEAAVGPMPENAELPLPPMGLSVEEERE